MNWYRCAYVFRAGDTHLDSLQVRGFFYAPTNRLIGRMRSFDDNAESSPKATPGVGKSAPKSGNGHSSDAAGSDNGSDDAFRRLSESLRAIQAPAKSGSEDAGLSPEPTGSAIANTGPISMRALFAPIGSHPILTDALIAQYCNELKTCLFDELAAATVGVSPNSLKAWVANGRKVHDYLWHNAQTYLNGTKYGEEQFTKAMDRLTQEEWQFYKLYTEREAAKAQSTRDDLDMIAKARSKDWKAAAYRLKIRDRVRFSDSPQVQINNSVTNVENANFAVIDYAEWVLGDEADPIEVQPTRDSRDMQDPEGTPET